MTSTAPLFSPLRLDLAAAEAALAAQTAEARTEWAVKTFGERLVLSSSFGAQAAVSLHMATQVAPGIPVVFIDTGYHFAETYQFVDALAARLKLNLKVYSSPLSPAWMEARHGLLWEQGVEGITEYNAIRKVEPMRRALAELGAWGWIAGLRRQQASSRKDLGVLGVQDGLLKVHPIVDWTDRDVFQYLTKHDLPYHPLWEQGYVSIGDTHTTRKLGEGMTEEETRFFGLKRECGLHLPTPEKDGSGI
ncbi:MAG TPA: phosphoadenylyl-sulfate reductase [Candidatus Methylacidiphilales bacterium]